MTNQRADSPDIGRRLSAAGQESWPDPERERAQPGDVLGIERGGETTSLGDTEEDEDEGRRRAEKEANE